MADLGTLTLGTYDATNSTTDAIVGSDPVLQSIASASDSSYIHDDDNNSNNADAYLDLGNTPSDFDTMDTLSIQLRYLRDANNANKTWDTLTAQVLTAFGGSALTNEVTVVSSITTTTTTNSSVVALTGVQASNKTTWDGAVVRIRMTKTKSMAGNSDDFRVTAASVTGTYTAGGTPGSASPAAISRSFTVDAATAAGAAVAAPATTARSFTVDAATPTNSDGTPGSATPALISVSGSVGHPGYADLDGTGDHLSCGDNAAFDITGDIDIRVGAKFDAVGAGDELLMARWNGGGDRHFTFVREGSTTISLYWWDGGLNSQISSTGLAVTTPRHYRATIDVDNGSSQHVITFYYSDQPMDATTISWTQHSQHTKSGTTSISGAGADGVTLGERIDTPGEDLDGRIYWAELYDGIDGTRVLNPDLRDTGQGNWASPPQTDDHSNSWAFSDDAVWVAPVDALPVAIPAATPANSDPVAGSASPAVTARSFTVDVPTLVGAAVAAPAATARSFTVDQVTPAAPTTVTPTTIARSFTVDPVTVAGQAVANPAATARSFSLGAVTLVGPAVFSPTTVARSFTVDLVSVAGAAVVAPASTDRVFLIPQATPTNSDGGAGVATPDVIARSFTVDAASLIGPAILAPAAIARSFTVDAVTTIGTATVTPSAITRSFTVDAVTPVAPATTAPAVIPLSFGLDQVIPVSGDGTVVSPATIARSFTVDSVTVVAGGVATPAAISSSFQVLAVATVGSAVSAPAAVATVLNIGAAIANGAAVVTPAATSLVVTIPQVTILAPSAGVATPAEIVLVLTIPQATPLAAAGSATPGLIGMSVVVYTPKTIIGTKTHGFTQRGRSRTPVGAGSGHTPTKSGNTGRPW